MTEGETRRFWIPKKLAYRGEPGKPEGMLVFDVELIEIVKPRDNGGILGSRTFQFLSEEIVCVRGSPLSSVCWC